MPQTNWCEPVGAVRGPAWYRQIWRHLTAGQGTAVYVVPDQTPLHEVALCLLECGNDTVLGGDVMMRFGQWLRCLAVHTYPIAPLPIRLLAIGEAFSRCALRYFPTSPRSVGTARYLLTGIETALSAGLDPGQLRQCAVDFGAERELDLADCAQQYLDILHETYGMIDPAQQALQALTAVRERALPWQTIMLDVGLAPLAIVESLLSAIALYHPRCTVHAIVANAAEDDHGLISHDSVTREVSPDELLSPGLATIELHRGASAIAEARWVVAHITHLVHAGHDPSRIGLILPDTTLAPLYHQMLREAGLCLFAEDIAHSSDHLRRHFAIDAAWEQAPPAAPWTTWEAWLREQIDQHAPRDLVAMRIREERDADLFIRCAQALCAWQRVWSAPAARTATKYTSALSREYVRDLVMASAPIPDAFADLSRAVPIRVCTVDALPARHFDVVFLPGAIDGQWPALQRTTFFPRLPTQLHTPALRQLRAAFPSAELQQQRAVRQWARWQTLADRVVVSYPETTLQGRPCFPSSLLGVATACTALPTLLPPATGQSHAALRSIAARATRERAIQDRIAADAGGWLLRDPAVIDHIRCRFATMTFSVTDLQHFVTCPFRFYAAVLLGIATPRADTADLDRRTRGDWLHRAMARMYQAHAADWTPLVHAAAEAQHAAIVVQAREALVATAHDLEDELNRHAPAFRNYAMEQLAGMITDCVMADLAHWRTAGPQALHPTYFEWGFGRHDVPPCVLDDGDRTVAIRGTIDRIDVHTPSGDVLVIDYKTGSADSIIGELKVGQHLQLPLYLEAVRQLLPTLQPIGGLLFHLRTGDRCHGLIRRDIGRERFQLSARLGSLVSDAQWDALRSTAAASAMAAAEQIRAGQIPWQVHRCEQCDWQALSRYEERDA